MTGRRLAATVLVIAMAVTAVLTLRAGGSRPAIAPPAAIRTIQATPSAKRTSPTAVVTTATTILSRRIDVPLAEPVPWTLPADGTPPGWNLKEFSGHADVELRRIDNQLAIRLRSDRSSFALYHDVALRVEAFPILSWSWKVMRLPRAGDVRVRGRDDQAAQLYVVFPRWPSPLVRSDVIGYVWDSTAPVDTRTQSPHSDNVRIIVVDSGRSGVGVWQRHERNVADDYAALFGGTPPAVGKIAIMIDSDDTKSDAEAYVGLIAFRRAP